jgi:hypothetical protein
MPLGTSGHLPDSRWSFGTIHAPRHLSPVPQDPLVAWPVAVQQPAHVDCRRALKAGNESGDARSKK